MPFKEKNSNRDDDLINASFFFAHCLEIWSEESQTEKDK